MSFESLKRLAKEAQKATIFDAVIDINTLDYALYQRMQQLQNQQVKIFVLRIIKNIQFM